MSKIYQFIGDGRGVPGLPHRLTEEDVLRLGCEKELADAIKAGNYEAIQEQAKTGAEKPPVENQDDKAGKKPAKRKEA